MSIPSERAEKAIIEPRRGKKESCIGPWAILAFTVLDVKHCLRCFKKEQGGQFFYNSSLYPEPFGSSLPSIVGPLLGAPQAVMAMEKLIALGATKFLTFGLCGSLQPHVAIGDLVLPDFAVSEEGVSQHYPLSGVQPKISKALQNMALDILSPIGVTLHKGGVWTTDAPFRETPSKVKDFQKRGLLAVDMELSALLTVSTFRGVDMVPIMIVSDLLYDYKWHHGFGEKVFHENHQKCIEAIVQKWPWIS